jgi:hypothetical protein
LPDNLYGFITKNTVKRWLVSTITILQGCHPPTASPEILPLDEKNQPQVLEVFKLPEADSSLVQRSLSGLFKGGTLQNPKLGGPRNILLYRSANNAFIVFCLLKDSRQSPTAPDCALELDLQKGNEGDVLLRTTNDGYIVEFHDAHDVNKISGNLEKGQRISGPHLDLKCDADQCRLKVFFPGDR